MTNGAPLSPLAAEEGRALVTLAREAAAAAVTGAPPPDPVSLPGRLGRPQAAFVTIRVGDDLRGCIGMIEATDPLSRVVLHCAAAAALQDPRFEPVRPDELPRATFEVSVLEPPRVIHGEEDVVLGRDGLIVSLGRRRGLLLPQVPAEHGWSRREFLEHTCRKAGLDPDAWRHGARVEAFSAQVFGEGSSLG